MQLRSSQQPDEIDANMYAFSAAGELEKRATIAFSCTGTASIPLGYDAQCTSSDAALIYLRARVYDPTTAQFLSRDPITSITWEPYSYVGEEPLGYVDPSGFEAMPFPFPVEGPETPLCLTPEGAVACGAGSLSIYEAKSLINAFAGEEAGNDEGEQILHERKQNESKSNTASLSPRRAEACHTEASPIARMSSTAAMGADRYATMDRTDYQSRILTSVTTTVW